MLWEVSGTDLATGASRTLVVEADDNRSAARRAGRRGLEPAYVRPLDPFDTVAGSPALVSPAAAAGGDDAGDVAEIVMFTTRLHPLAAFSGAAVCCLFFAAVGIPVAILAGDLAGVPPTVAANNCAAVPACAAVGALAFVPAWLRYRSNRFSITFKRLTIRTGWLSRASFEMLLTKVEIIQIQQTMFERLTGAGTVVVHGTGGSREPFDGIRAAVRFRAAAKAAIERYGARSRV